MVRPVRLNASTFTEITTMGLVLRKQNIISFANDQATSNL
jgi:hypothetical protein